jgi:predicted flap endonuclease-1-like 5' DNA nuclease
MSVAVGKLKVMAPEPRAKLLERGIRNSDQLLEAARTPDERKVLAEQTGIAPEAILELANRADLARIRGVGQVYANLLEEAGVDTVKELAVRVPANLYAKLLEVNAEKKLAGRAPTLPEVKKWVTQAKRLRKLLEY